jgi:DNA-binding NtrC family response regulator
MKYRSEDDHPLRGTRILVVDDEFLIAASIEHTLREAGADTVTAATVPAALRTADDGPLSAALLDVRLGPKTTEAVADLLAARAVPFVFYSGERLPNSMRDKHPTVKVLLKPVDHAVFVETLLEILKHR